MAFTNGVPAAVITPVSERLMRLAQHAAGVEVPFQLGAGATGTIGLFEKTVAADQTLPAVFQPRPYERPDGTIVSLQDSIEVTVNRLNAGAVLQPINVVKTGTTPEDFEISLTAPGGASGQLEIYVAFH